MECFGEETEFQYHTIHRNLKCQGLNGNARTNRTKTEHSALILTRSINPSISLQLVPYNNFAFYGAVNTKQKLNAFHLLSWLVWHVLKILTLIAVGCSELKNIKNQIYKPCTTTHNFSSKYTLNKNLNHCLRAEKLAI